MAENWLTTTLPLDRPEYSKQTEALLTDLLWSSPGSTLFNISRGRSYLDEHLSGRRTIDGHRPLDRIVFERVGRKAQNVVESLPLARGTDLSTVLGSPQSNECLVALLESLKAPRSRSYRSVSAVPLHPDLVVLQTLPGIVNKPSPPNLAKIIEQVGRLGGSDGKGAVAHRFLEAFADPVPAQAGLSGLAAAAFRRIAGHVWDGLERLVQPVADRPWPVWPSVSTQEYDRESTQLPIARLRSTPFRWFWTKWVTICDPNRGWKDRLPQRRWLDWSLTLLRTALAFSYLWEAEFLLRIRDRIVERRRGDDGPAKERLAGFLNGQFTLVTVHPRKVPPYQKRVWNALSSNLTRGYAFRKLLTDGSDNNPLPDLPSEDLRNSLPQWIEELGPAELEALAEPLVITSATATNAKEFVRYLMLPRSADDDSSDQADLYFLARSQRTNFWIELGPEWLVVETALLAGEPGGKCTLRQLLDDLSQLGIAVDRRTLVGLLEDTGLSADSPDADDALVIESGF